MQLPSPEQVSSIIEGTDIRACGYASDFKPDTPYHDKPPVTTSYDLLKHSTEKSPDADCLGWRASDASDAPFEWWSYKKVLELSDALGRAFAARGLIKGDKVGMYAKNCAQWALMQYAIMSQGMIIVPIYDTLGPNTVEYVCNHAETKMVCVSPENYPKLASVRDAGKIPTVTDVVIIGGRDIEPTPENISGEGIVDVVAFLDEGKKLAKEGLHPPPKMTLDDLQVIMYTSGTTGDPKGVMLKHRAFVASVAAAYFFFTKWNLSFTNSDSFLSYLPLSHIYEQQAEALLIGVGGKIGYYSGNIKLLLNDLEMLKPTIFAGVPRVYARFQQRIEENVENSSFLKKTLFNWAYSRQVKAVENPEKIGRNPLWDKLVMDKVRDKLLPNARFMITGSAPMSAQTNDFLKVCMHCPVAQGYGLTETVGGMNCSIPGHSKSGHVGGPLPGVQVKLADLPEMGYQNSDKPCPRGEICVKGDIVFSGYYKNKDATSKSFDEDGFFRTGDVGMWREDGTLQIIDRAKNLFKLSQGEYVSPEALEQEYAKAKLVGQIFVYGNSLQSTLLAVVVPDIVAAKAWGESKGLSSLESIVAAPDFKKELLEQLAEMRVKSNFKKYEEIKNVIIECSDLNELGQAFHVDNNLMTPSYKPKRPQLKAKYQEALDALYSSN